MKYILKLTKYSLIIFFTLTLIFFVSFFIYSKRLNYSIPKNMNIEFYDVNGDLFLTINNDSKNSYVKIEDINQNLINAFISIEDKTFYKHKGINLFRIISALISNIKNKKIVQGASTITQQYARNLYLNNDKNIKRKIDEIMIAINLETKYSKNEILEGYLNTIYFDHGIYGIEDASRFYFNKSAKDLNLLEAVTLASIPKGPVYYSPIKNPENNEKRRSLILDEMVNDNYINKETAEKTKKMELKLHGSINSTNSNNAPYFQDIVIQELKNLNIPYNYLKDGIKVYTTLDLRLNKILQNSIEKYYPKNSNLEIAIFAMDPKTGNVLDVIGGINYEASKYNRATKSLRQPGSAIKPFLYYTALEHGFTPATTFRSEKTDFYIDGEIYSPTNYNDIYPNQEVTLAYALATSDNIFAIKTHLFLGTDKLVKTLKDFGFTNEIKNNTSLALGTSEVSLKELVAGYSKIASMGKDISPNYIKNITSSSGKTIYKNTNETDDKFDSSTCYILSETMTNVFDNNLAININTTGATIAAKLTKKYAAKSGSTNTDNWMIGFNKNIVLGIWTGYDNNEIVKNSLTKYIKNIWADAMESYNISSNEQSWYTQPKNVIGIELNPTNGMIAKGNEYKKRLYFKNNNLPFYLYK